MDPDLRPITAPEEALALAPALDARAAEFLAQFTDEPYPEGATARFLERSFEDPATLLLVAEVGEPGAFAGLCLTGPLVDPLLGTATPTVLILHVETAWRHRGVAGHLIEESRRLLGARGLGQLAGRVGHNDDALISMGERWGFVRQWELMVRE
jgi:GNAT superfamily N-acetyltransferase